MNKAEATDSLIFIPDISGYTKFVNSTEINHARHIIEELLEVIIDANDIGLELSEIEGDALLFYRRGKAPTAPELLAQVEKMYVAFHRHLKKYETQRICSCGACCSANNLNLKFVAHYGEMAEKQVKGRPVLFGADVIMAHRLLKNKIDSDEYGLFSQGLQQACSTWEDLESLSPSKIWQQEEQYDFGKAQYTYLDLGVLSSKVPEPEIEDYSIEGATQMIFETEAIIDAPLDLTFNVVSDYTFRHEFVVGQIGSDMINHKIFQNGSVHRCVLNTPGSDPILVAHDYALSNNKATFVETNKKNSISTVWSLEALGPGQTKVSISNFTKPNVVKTFLFNLFMRKRFEKSMQKSWNQLNAYCQDLIKKNEQHPNMIQLPVA